MDHVPTTSSGVDLAATTILWSRSYSYENPIGVDHAATKIQSIVSYTTDIQRSGSETTKIRLIGSFMKPQKTDENDFVVTEIKHNGSFRRQKYFGLWPKQKYKGLDHVAANRPK